MPDPRSLLPLNDRTPLEEAISLVVAERRPLPTALVKSVMDPYACPLELLPYLAAGLGFELDITGWPEQKQRDTVAGVWLLKRRKTKLKGVAAYLDLVGSRLENAHRPKDKFWWSGGMSAAQRAAMIAEMPQVRIYPSAFPERPAAPLMVWGRGAWGTRAWRASTAPAAYEDRARYVDGGVSTPVSVSGITGPLDPDVQVRLVAESTPARMFFGYSAWGATTWRDSDAADHVMTITPDQGAPLAAVPAGLIPATVQPVPVADQAPAPAGQGFHGRSAWGAFAWRSSSAAEQVYQRYTLLDPSRAVPARQPYSFWGHTRWGRPAYEADLLVDVPMQMPGWRFGMGRPWGRSFWGRSDFAPYWSAVSAVRTAKAYRDTVWIDTTLFQPVEFSPGLRFGDVDFPAFGSYRKAT